MYSYEVENMISEAASAAATTPDEKGGAAAKALCALAAAVLYAANNASISVSLDTQYPLNIGGDLTVHKPFGE